MAIAIVLTVLLIAVVLFITEVLPIDLVAVLMLLGLTLTRVLDVKEGLSGFSDPAVMTIAGFFVISAALFNTGVVEAIGRHIHRVSGSNKVVFLLVLMLTAAALASFLSNVVTTAVLMPAVFAIARRLKEPVSKFLMPLSFAAVLARRQSHSRQLLAATRWQRRCRCCWWRRASNLRFERLPACLLPRPI